MPVKQRNQIIYRDDILNLVIDASKYKNKSSIIVYDVNVEGSGYSPSDSYIVGEFYAKDVRHDDNMIYTASLPVLFTVGDYTDTWRFVFDADFEFPANFPTMTKSERDCYWENIIYDKGEISSSFRVFPDIYQKVNYTILCNLTFNLTPHYFYVGSKVYARVKIGLGRTMARDDARYQYEMIRRCAMNYDVYRVSDNGCSSRWVYNGQCLPLDDYSYGFMVDTTGDSVLGIPGTYFTKVSINTPDGQTIESPRMSFNIFNDRQSGTLIKKCGE